MAKTPRTPPEEEPRLRWLGLPGVYCDTFTLDSWTSGVVRIAFGEYTDPEHYPWYRTAVVMPISDVKALARALTRVVTEAEAEAEAEAEREKESASTVRKEE